MTGQSTGFVIASACESNDRSELERRSDMTSKTNQNDIQRILNLNVSFI